MGSFNTSCFVSRQTIAPGDPCIVVPIRQESTYEAVALDFRGQRTEQYGICSSTCYPTRFWRPVGSFLEAKYDDYGRFELLDTPLNAHRLAHFIGNALELTPVVEQGKNQYHDLPCNLRAFMQKEAPTLLAWFETKRGETPPEIPADQRFSLLVSCWDHLFEVANEQRLFWQDYQAVPRPLGFAVMHRLAYQRLVDLCSSTRGWRGESYDMADYLHRALNSQADAATPGSSTRESRMLTAMTAREALCRVGSYEGSAYPGERDVMQFGLEAFLDGKLTEATLLDKLRPWLEVRYACSSLGALNLHFEPMVYAGQDYHNDIGASYARFVQEVSRDVTRGRHVHYGCELFDYRLTAAGGTELFKDLAKMASENDGYLEVVSSVPDPSHTGCWRIDFKCNIEPEDLTEVLAEYNLQTSGNRVFGNTLTRLNTATP